MSNKLYDEYKLQVYNLSKQCSSLLSVAPNIDDIEKIRVEFFGKKGHFTLLIKEIFADQQNDINFEQKKEIGKIINDAKNCAVQELEQIKNTINLQYLNKQLLSESINISLPSRHQRSKGKIHRLSDAAHRISVILQNMGLEFIESDEVETDWYNFTALNIPEYHPARLMHDTFYLNNDKLLRTHTTPTGVHYMMQYKHRLTESSFGTFTIGKVYRSDSSDSTHLSAFHQVDGILIGKDVDFSHLLYLIDSMLKQFFQCGDLSTSFRPSYFPFTEPSAEVDIIYNNKTIELMGCGMLHPNVLHNAGVPEMYTGVAFGMGLERIACIFNQITDIRSFYAYDNISYE